MLFRSGGAIADAEQVLITAAVGSDVPDFPAERRFLVTAGTVSPVVPPVGRPLDEVSARPAGENELEAP